MEEFMTNTNRMVRLIIYDHFVQVVHNSYIYL